MDEKDDLTPQPSLRPALPPLRKGEEPAQADLVIEDDISMSGQPLAKPESNKRASSEEAEQAIRRMSRRSFLWGGVTVAAGFAGWKWLTTRRDEDGIAWPFRRALELNEQLARDYFSGARLAPTFPRADAREPRANGDVGLSEDFDPEAWRLRVVGLNTIPDGATMDEQAMEPTLLLTLDDIQKLPRIEMVTELKCIEGWSEVVHWAGARLVDFLEKYPPYVHSDAPPDVRKRPDDLPQYVGMETPDGGYYVGLDRESALHPQTLLCYEMNGSPLTPEHGAPLRLVIPFKYGIKNIKRIGTIRFADRRPADYWAENGYDWYAGH
jgi:DMSO/TMAO reductase YedYZ molybdopterin-dependent catalytic subunit